MATERPAASFHHASVLFGGAVVAALSAPTPILAAAPKHAIDIRPQPLSSALLALQRQTGAPIIASGELVRGRAAPAVKGFMSPAEAVRRLLVGSSIQLSVGSDGAFILNRDAPLLAKAAPVARPSIAPLVELPSTVSAVHVVAVSGAGGLEARRLASVSQDVVKGDDLHGLPDPSLGGAMELLPGAVVTGDAGEVRQVSVRGVGSEYTRVRINGMETLATFGGAHAGGGTNRGRAFDYNVFAADLFTQIRLQKTASADVDEGSLGATVDLQTRSPFDGPRSRLRLTVEGGYNAGSDRLGPGVSAVFARRTQDDRFGVLLSGAYSERSLVDAGTNAGLWQTGDTVYPGFGASAPGAPSLGVVNAALHPRIPRLELLRSSQKRLGLTAGARWRLSARTKMAIDVLYSELASRRREDLLETFTFRTAGACQVPLNPDCGLAAVRVNEAVVTTPRPGLPVLIAGVFDHVDVRTESRQDRLKTIFRQTTLSLSHAFSNRLTLKVLAGYSRSDFSNPVQQTLQLDQFDVNGFSYDFRNARRPLIAFGDADLTHPKAWTLAELRSEPNWVDNSFRTLDLDLAWSVTPTMSVRGGLLHKAYRTESVNLGRSDGSIANLNADIPAALAAIPSAAYLRSVRSSRFSTKAGSPDGWLAADVSRAMELFAAACSPTVCDALGLGPEPLRGLNYAVGEQDRSAYLQVAFDVPSRWRLRGDAGVRYAHTAQTSEGFTLDPGAAGLIAPVRVGRAYDDLLPAINLVVEPRRNLLLRLGAAKVMTRPDPRSLGPGVTLSTGGLRAVSAGNPFLRPSRADTLDAAVEWYFRPGAIVSAAWFHKTVRSSLQSMVTSPMVFAANPFGLPDSVATVACGRLVGCAPDLPIWQFVVRTDRGGGRLDGVELAFQTPLEPVAAPLDGWSVRAAATYTRARMRYWALDGAPLIARDSLGSPRLAASLSMIYRDQSLDARATLSHRGRYLTAIPSPTGGGDIDGVNAYTSLDVSSRYRLRQGWWLTGAVANLTNSANRQFTDQVGLANYQHHTGREFRLGLEMRF